VSGEFFFIHCKQNSLNIFSDIKLIKRSILPAHLTSEITRAIILWSFLCFNKLRLSPYFRLQFSPVLSRDFAVSIASLS